MQKLAAKGATLLKGNPWANVEVCVVFVLDSALICVLAHSCRDIDYSVEVWSSKNASGKIYSWAYWSNNAWKFSRFAKQRCTYSACWLCGAFSNYQRPATVHISSCSMKKSIKPWCFWRTRSAVKKRNMVSQWFELISEVARAHLHFNSSFCVSVIICSLYIRASTYSSLACGN